MLDFPRWKTIGISIILLLGILFSIPSFLPTKTFESLPGFAQAKVNLGLDLAGGSHLLLEAVVERLEPMALSRVLLATRDAHEIYARFGFEPLPEPDMFMVRS